VAFDVREPRIDRARDALRRWVLATQLLAPQQSQLRVVALQQPAMQILLGGEVVVDDRRRYAGALGDLVD
jgi:hypothetical protein